MNTEPQEPIELKLDKNSEMGSEEISVNPQQQTVPEKPPVIGWIAIGSGIIGLFTLAIIFVPIALVCSIIALFMRQWLFAFIGAFLAVIGFLTSPVWLGITFLGTVAAYFGF